MKKYFIKSVFFALVAVCSLPAMAQKEKEPKAPKEPKEPKDVQQVIITRKGGANEKTIIEINGDKVTVNGKDAKDIKDITVRVNKLKDISALASARVRSGTQNWDFNFDLNGDRVSLFSEDSNRAMLGVVTDVNDKGAEITSVTKESAAEKAGLKKGDIITKIGDRKIEDAGDVTTAIRGHKPGDKVAITVLREGKEQRISAELGKWKGIKMNPMNLSPGRIFTPNELNDMNRIETFPGGRSFYMESGRPKLGLSIQDTEEGKGVKVTDVDGDSQAEKAGLKENDIITHINDREVNSTDEISRIVRENREKPSVRLQVLRNGKTQNIEVRMPRKLKSADL